VSLKSQKRIITLHSTPIIDDPNERATSLLEPHLDRASSRIERIIAQLTHNRCGTLDNLARGDLVDD
jgi:hypothetical protein